jgi:hypothetical protein
MSIESPVFRPNAVFSGGIPADLAGLDGNQGFPGTI